MRGSQARRRLRQMRRLRRYPLHDRLVARIMVRSTLSQGVRKRAPARRLSPRAAGVYLAQNMHLHCPQSSASTGPKTAGGQPACSSAAADTLRTLNHLEAGAQLNIWTRMIQNHPFDLEQLMSLHHAIEDRIRIDIVSGVPYEIALYIMSFLSPADLAAAAQTCRSWRTVCEDSRLWREKCREEGLLEDPLTLDVLFRRRLQQRNRRHQERAARHAQAPEEPHWRQAYLRHMDILRNWRHRKFEISEPFIAPNSSASSASSPSPAPAQGPSGGPSASANSAGVPKLSSGAARTTPFDGSHLNNNNNNPNNPNGQNNNTARRRAGSLARPPAGRRYSSRQAARALASQAAAAAASAPADQQQPQPRHHSDHDQEQPPRQLDVARCASDASSPERGPQCRPKSWMQLRCHEESVITCLQFNPRTCTIVSGSDDQTLKVWSSETGRCLTTLEGHTGGVWSSQLSPDDTVVSGSTDRTLKVWRAHSGELLHTLYGHTSTVRCLALDGQRVVSGSRDTTLRLWDIDKGACLHVFAGHSAAVRCVEFKNDVIVSGAYDHLVMVWDALRGACLHALECHQSRIYSLQFDGKTIASGSLDSTICIWDAASGQLRHRLAGHQSLTSKMQLKGSLLVSANADSFCKVWNINTGECLQTLGGEWKHTSAITSVYFNNRHVVTSSDDGTVKLWDIRSGRFIRDLVVLPTASNGGVVWRIRASYTKLICAVGSRTQTEDTHLLVLDFNE